MFVVFLIHFQRVHFVLFKLLFLLMLINLVSKTVFVTKFACANLAAKLFAPNLSNSEVVKYLSWSWSVTFFSILLVFAS